MDSRELSSRVSPRLKGTRYGLALALALGVVAGCVSGPGRSPARPALQAGTSGDYPPFSDWRGERPSGFSVALVDAFATDQGLEPSWVRFRWSEHPLL